MLPIKSKYKIAKRLGAHIFPQTQTQKFALSEARTKKQKSHKRAGSDFSKQLLEKQRVRYTYGLSERQLSNYAARAMKDPNPPQALHRAFELRLDSVVYRAGFAHTRRSARQSTSHGHFTVNGRRVTTPSFQLSLDDVVAVREGKTRASPLFSALTSNEGEDIRAIPSWLSVDISLLQTTVSSLPEYTQTEGGLEYPLVFEYYSR
ncbi:hypothetical protein A2673_01005 [Candidatus Kaiserbacteria bacterium RIFCSPHIGHO2_01_FULL_50_13]|uniref:Small ribosomal subunit protein uS4 n=1 Tax=Candidatus Kaiserbacteria bacterium RIFCSPLOWO2_01_FULL_50_24 TaxID=1798507 RepID=A0A1F6EMS2_9BACT|nr:MAG: hypothetical protein A2673_01005 [Candidatus Kaiserbacteria bacterium RIFCSPHIGHO2_01_FULL_50_13]OGG74944.1 MAG: hypothetical protein A3A34_03965 [Candidatus Kaiserbacteria bacterium RIFCSPLOWO2_01_FULL_50_24]OGG81746.1 MAG: hypothetical protein A3H74_01040 [Candidatus Kaiserbacteria bacterium RIFCSPLOWO2_02_FULL_51_13]